jgi:antibiotic biosynthesis monooxygenase (ABM) superfamily enzyme
MNASPSASLSSLPSTPPVRRPNRHKMVLLTWLGIWPTITVVLEVLLPILLPRFPLPLVTLMVTALVVPLMGYVVMPNLARWFGDWLHR